jgi:glycosyltransferase involved in cell wall biosynthesis
MFTRRRGGVLATEIKPAALMLSPEMPFPMAGGGPLRTASLLYYLVGRYEVDLVVFCQPDDSDPARAVPDGLVRRISVIELPRHNRSLAARALRNAVRAGRSMPPLIDRFSGFEREIECAIAGRRYNLGIVEHFWCAPYFEQISKVCERTMLDLHNLESLLHARCAAAGNGSAGFAHRLFQHAALELERVWLPRFSQVLTTSEEDSRRVHEIAPGTRTSVYPNAIHAVPRPLGGDEEVIVFSGNMEYHPNRLAVQFFRSEVWPQLRERWPSLVWRLVGKNPQAVRELTEGDPRIEVTGPVDDAIHELARARIAVVPLTAGSGTRLKILEAWAAGLPVVSTTIGAEGLSACHHQHLVLADTATAFAAAVSRLLACPETRMKLGMAGRLLLEKEFTWEKAWEKLDF